MMNAAHLHLVLNHFPVIGSAIAIFVLGFQTTRQGDEGSNCDSDFSQWTSFDSSCWSLRCLEVRRRSLS